MAPTMRAEMTAIMTPLPRNVIAAPIMGRPRLGGKIARSAKFQQNQGMCRGHALCTSPEQHDRSGGLGGSTGNGAVRGAAVPSAGGAAPPEASGSSAQAHSGGFRRRDVRCRSISTEVNP